MIRGIQSYWIRGIWAEVENGKYTQILCLIIPFSEIILLNVKVESVFYGYHADIIGDISAYNLRRESDHHVEEKN